MKNSAKKISYDKKLFKEPEFDLMNKKTIFCPSVKNSREKKKFLVKGKKECKTRKKFCRKVSNKMKLVKNINQ